MLHYLVSLLLMICCHGVFILRRGVSREDDLGLANVIPYLRKLEKSYGGIIDWYSEAAQARAGIRGWSLMQG